MPRLTFFLVNNLTYPARVMMPDMTGLEALSGIRKLKTRRKPY